MAATAPLLFDEFRLSVLARAHREVYAVAQPFPHVVIDDFLPADVVERIVAEFPGTERGAWIRYDHTTEKDKFQLSDEARIPSFIRGVFYAFNSAVFMRFLQELTGIKGLIPDPYLWGGGLHQTRRGGRLGIHADFHHHPELNLDRRLNVLLFLNRDWKPEYGGELELWNRGMTACVQRILPILNRCVVFGTTDWSFHGQPEPLQCPENVTRRSLALYYYTNGRPSTEILPRKNTTLFRRRPGTEEPDNLFALRVRHFLRQCIPPIVLDVKRRLFPR